jgi:hypothetical protein
VYRIILRVVNPMTTESRTLDYQFDPASMTQAKWDGAYAAVQAKINELTTAAPTSEPPTW